MDALTMRSRPGIVCSAVTVDLAKVVLHSTTSDIRAVAHDAAGNIYVAGELRGGDFQAVRPIQTDGGLFLMKLNASGDVLLGTPLGTHGSATCSEVSR